MDELISNFHSNSHVKSTHILNDSKGMCCVTGSKRRGKKKERLRARLLMYSAFSLSRCVNKSKGKEKKEEKALYRSLGHFANLFLYLDLHNIRLGNRSICNSCSFYASRGFLHFHSPGLFSKLANISSGLGSLYGVPESLSFSRVVVVKAGSLSGRWRRRPPSSPRS